MLTTSNSKSDSGFLSTATWKSTMENCIALVSSIWWKGERLKRPHTWGIIQVEIIMRGGHLSRNENKSGHEALRLQFQHLLPIGRHSIGLSGGCIRQPQHGYLTNETISNKYTWKVMNNPTEITRLLAELPQDAQNTPGPKLGQRFRFSCSSAIESTWIADYQFGKIPIYCEIN